MSETRRNRLLRLTAEVLRLRLMQANLVVTGSKKAMVQRLLDHTEESTASDQEHSDADPATPSDAEHHLVPARSSSPSSRSSSSTPPRGGPHSLRRPRPIAASPSPSTSSASKSPSPDAGHHTGRRKVAAATSPVPRLDQAQRRHRRRSRSWLSQADVARSPSNRARAPKRRSRRSSSQEGHRPRKRYRKRDESDSSHSKKTRRIKF